MTGERDEHHLGKPVEKPDLPLNTLDMPTILPA